MDVVKNAVNTINDALLTLVLNILKIAVEGLIEIAKLLIN